MGLSRTVLDGPKVDLMEQDREVIAVLNEILSKRSRTQWGVWKCFDRMRLDGYRFNHKCVHRVYYQMKRRTKKRVMTRPAQPLDHVEELNQVWSLDFMRDTLYDSRL